MVGSSSNKSGDDEFPTAEEDLEEMLGKPPSDLFPGVQEMLLTWKVYGDLKSRVLELLAPDGHESAKNVGPDVERDFLVRALIRFDTDGGLVRSIFAALTEQKSNPPKRPRSYSRADFGLHRQLLENIFLPVEDDVQWTSQLLTSALDTLAKMECQRYEDIKKVVETVDVKSNRRIDIVAQTRPDVAEQVRKLKRFNQKAKELYAVIFIGIRICMITRQMDVTGSQQDLHDEPLSNALRNLKVNIYATPQYEEDRKHRVMQYLNTLLPPNSDRLGFPDDWISHHKIFEIRQEVYVFLMRNPMPVSTAEREVFQANLQAKATLGGWAGYIRPTLSQYFDVMEDIRRIYARELLGLPLESKPSTARGTTMPKKPILKSNKRFRTGETYSGQDVDEVVAKELLKDEKFEKAKKVRQTEGKTKKTVHGLVTHPLFRGSNLSREELVERGLAILPANQALSQPQTEAGKAGNRDSEGSIYSTDVPEAQAEEAVSDKGKERGRPTNFSQPQPLRPRQARSTAELRGSSRSGRSKSEPQNPQKLADFSPGKSSRSNSAPQPPDSATESGAVTPDVTMTSSNQGNVNRLRQGWRSTEHLFARFKGSDATATDPMAGLEGELEEDIARPKTAMDERDRPMTPKTVSFHKSVRDAPSRTFGSTVKGLKKNLFPAKKPEPDRLAIARRYQMDKARTERLKRDQIVLRPEERPRISPPKEDTQAPVADDSPPKADIDGFIQVLQQAVEVETERQNVWDPSALEFSTYPEGEAPRGPDAHEAASQTESESQYTNFSTAGKPSRLPRPTFRRVLLPRVDSQTTLLPLGTRRLESPERESRVSLSPARSARPRASPSPTRTARPKSSPSPTRNARTNSPVKRSGMPYGSKQNSPPKSTAPKISPTKDATFKSSPGKDKSARSSPTKKGTETSSGSPAKIEACGASPKKIVAPVPASSESIRSMAVEDGSFSRTHTPEPNLEGENVQELGPPTAQNLSPIPPTLGKLSFEGSLGKRLGRNCLSIHLEQGGEDKRPSLHTSASSQVSDDPSSRTSAGGADIHQSALRQRVAASAEQTQDRGSTETVDSLLSQRLTSLQRRGAHRVLRAAQPASKLSSQPEAQSSTSEATCSTFGAVIEEIDTDVQRRDFSTVPPGEDVVPPLRSVGQVAHQTAGRRIQIIQGEHPSRQHSASSSTFGAAEDHSDGGTAKAATPQTEETMLPLNLMDFPQTRPPARMQSSFMGSGVVASREREQRDEFWRQHVRKAKGEQQEQTEKGDAPALRTRKSFSDVFVKKTSPKESDAPADSESSTTGKTPAQRTISRAWNSLKRGTGKLLPRKSLTNLRDPKKDIPSVEDVEVAKKSSSENQRPGTAGTPAESFPTQTLGDNQSVEECSIHSQLSVQLLTSNRDQGQPESRRLFPPCPGPPPSAPMPPPPPPPPLSALRDFHKRRLLKAGCKKTNESTTGKSQKPESTIKADTSDMDTTSPSERANERRELKRAGKQPQEDIAGEVAQK